MILYHLDLYFSQKDINSELSVTTNNINEETLNTITDTNVVESKSNFYLFISNLNYF